MRKHVMYRDRHGFSEAKFFQRKPTRGFLKIVFLGMNNHIVAKKSVQKAFFVENLASEKSDFSTKEINKNRPFDEKSMFFRLFSWKST